MGIGFEKSNDLNLEKQPSAEFLNLNGVAIAAITSELREAVQATAAMRS